MGGILCPESRWRKTTSSLYQWRSKSESHLSLKCQPKHWPWRDVCSSVSACLVYPPFWNRSSHAVRARWYFRRWRWRFQNLLLFPGIPERKQGGWFDSSLEPSDNNGGHISSNQVFVLFFWLWMLTSELPSHCIAASEDLKKSFTRFIIHLVGESKNIYQQKQWCKFSKQLEPSPIAVSSSFSSIFASMKFSCSIDRIGLRPLDTLSARDPLSLYFFRILATVCRLILMPSSWSWHTIALMLFDFDESDTIRNFT